MLAEQGKDDLAKSIKDIGGSNAKYISVDQGEPKGLGQIGCAENYIEENEFFVVLLADDLFIPKNVMCRTNERAS